MISFLKFHFRQLLTFSQLFVFILFTSFAWFLSSPSLFPGIIYDSEKVIATYNNMLFSVGLMNFILNIISHFTKELYFRRYQITLSRLTDVKFFYGLVLTYLMYFLFTYLIPSYMIALIQQYLYAPQKINLWYYILSCSVGLSGYIIVWIILSLLIIIKTGSEFRTLLLMGIIYSLSLIINYLTNSIVFNNQWFVDLVMGEENILSGVCWLILICFAIIGGYKLSLILKDINFTKKYPKGIFAKILDKFNAKLTSYHARMIGFENQKLIAFFVLLGLFSFLPLLKKEGIDILPLVQIYLGGFIALFFSFNQYYLIKIDIDAGMIHNNYLRALPYTRIIINRWLVSLIPHIITLLICILIVYISGIKFSIEKILYIIALNIFCSLLNLMFAVVILINAAANMLLILFVYGQLIDDIQRFIAKYPLIRSFNIFSPLLMESEASIELWAFLLLAIFLVFNTIVIKLNRIKYDTLILD